jgi:hypothetical protein
VGFVFALTVILVSSSRFGSWHGQPIDADKLSRALAQMSIVVFSGRQRASAAPMTSLRGPAAKPARG